MDPPYYFSFEKTRTRVLFERADYHGKEGIIHSEQIEAAESGDILTTHLNQRVRIYRATATDVIESFRNGPQNITLKDASYLIGRCGITRASSVIEAGTGSGSLTAYLSLHAGRVVSFEMRKDFHELAAKNLTRLSSISEGENIELHEGPLEQAPESMNSSFDACILDMPEPWSCYDAAVRLLVPGGHLVCYVPNATQASTCAARASAYRFDDLENVEMIRREWRFTERIAKPGKEVMHTAFLLFFRKSAPEEGITNV